VAKTKKAQAIQDAKAAEAGTVALVELQEKYPAQTIGDLTGRAMLVDMNIHQWVAAKFDKQVTREVAENHNMTDRTMGHYRKKLIAPAAIAKIRKISAELYIEHRRRTLPWFDGGIRILSSAAWLDYQTAMAKLQDEWNEAVEEFLKNYPTYREEARAVLNGLFKEDDYPTPRRIREKFALAWRFDPMPSSDDFRRTFSGDAAEALIKQAEHSYGLATREAMRDIFKRMKLVVGKMVERLSVYKVEDGKAGRIYDSMLEHVRELVEILPSLNFVGDAAVEEFTRRMQDELLKYDTDTLKTSVEARQQTVKSAEEILEAMAEFI
jgi:hypothetical protein